MNTSVVIHVFFVFFSRLVDFTSSSCSFLVERNRYKDSERRFQHVLEACGVNKSLTRLGVKEGDTVFVGEVPLPSSIIGLYAFVKVVY